MTAARVLPLIACLLALSAASGRGEDLPETMEPPEPKPAEAQPAEEAEPVAATPPAGEAACRARLRALGVVFEEHPPIDEPEGCSAPHPLTVSQLPGGVELRPQAVLTCAMAEATALFVRDHAAPLTRQKMGSDLAAIDQVSSYVCRPRNNTQRLSEHAFANALDWGALELEDGTVVEVRPYGQSELPRARFIYTLMKAACGPFTTVLGPGSDADHVDHFHFDLAERRGGAAYCR